MKKTQEEVDSEIERLKELSGHIRRYSLFGDDNEAALQAELNVLEAGLTEDDIGDYYDSSPTNVYDAAWFAMQWREGDTSADEGSPADNWEHLRQ